MKFHPSLLIAPFCITAIGTAHAYTAAAITEMKVKDSGGTATINVNANQSQAPDGTITKTGDGGKIRNVSGDLNLVSFIASGQTYLASNFISGVGTSTIIDPTQIGFVMQPADYLTPTTAGGTGRTTSNNSGFFTGTTDANGDLINGSAYLTSGERGLSYSSVLNYRPGTDPSQLLTIPLNFLSNPTAAGITQPTFFAGDGADAQENDIWRFRNASGETIAEVTIKGTNDAAGSDWTQFGTHTIDRLSTNWDGTADDFNDNLTLDIALLAFNLDTGDFNIGGTDKSTRWAEITELQLLLPGDQNINPRTDYAFIGIDQGLVNSDYSVVPEPSTSLLLGVFGISLTLRRSRKRSLAQNA